MHSQEGLGIHDLLRSQKLGGGHHQLATTLVAAEKTTEMACGAGVVAETGGI
ncbi:MAG: hypothetical protein JO022_04815, partial [Acidobacteriaceae bacterium]|nr:hypothetical protein [Acidobacteriaceae bacterium]